VSMRFDPAAYAPYRLPPAARLPRCSRRVVPTFLLGMIYACNSDVIVMKAMYPWIDGGE
jgi:hypothetical protein